MASENMINFRLLAFSIVLISSLLFLSGCIVSVYSQTTHVPSETTQSQASFYSYFSLQQIEVGQPLSQQPDAPAVFHIASAGKVANKGQQSPAASIPQANYDEQLGLTFTQSFTSLAYNVTAVAQSDTYGYGPAYLLNGLTDLGYWYQVGLAWNWPYSSGGYNAGFRFFYEVFNAGGSSIFPTSGGGGLTSFSGPVNAGDSMLLNLYFSGGNVVMYAYDWNTRASAWETYSAEGATVFQGSPSSTSNSNGFFTGLMTEWYHTSPYYGDEGRVTFTDYTLAKTSAWMWIDEYYSVPANLLFFESTPSPVIYTSHPETLQSFSSHGTAEYSNAYEFVTGSQGISITSISLLPAGRSALLSSSNEFVVSYTLLGELQTAYAQNGALSLSTDSGTLVSISGASNGSTSSEKWVLNSRVSPVSVVSGSNVTLYYYDVLLQAVSYTVSGGGTPANPILSYSSSPPTASSQGSQTITVLSLSGTPQTIWVSRGSTVSVSDSISGGSSERWSTGTSEWVISTSYQLPSPIVYYHQYLVSFQFKDSTGVKVITPVSFQILVNDYSVISVPNFELWLDSGSRFQIYTVMWENVDVKSTDNATYTVNAPLNEVILCRIYDARLVVSDYLGIPISGARVMFTLTNGTIVYSTTGSDGSVNLSMIPLGTFRASVSNLGTTTMVLG